MHVNMTVEILCIFTYVLKICKKRQINFSTECTNHSGLPSVSLNSVDYAMLSRSVYRKIDRVTNICTTQGQLCVMKKFSQNCIFHPIYLNNVYLNGNST
jgi:hypothetical protein